MLLASAVHRQPLQYLLVSTRAPGCVHAMKTRHSSHGTLGTAAVRQVDAGVDKDLVFGDPTAPRFVFWDKKLRATPSGPDALTFDLLSIWGKIRAGLGAVGIVKGGPMPGQHGAHGLACHVQCLRLQWERLGQSRPYSIDVRCCPRSTAFADM